MSNRKAIIVDLDGTLCDSEHRVHFVRNKQWDKFYEGLVDDNSHEWCVDLVESFFEYGYEIIFVTGRSDKYEDLTNDWLMKNLPESVYDWLLYMRAEGDFRKDWIVKEELYNENIKSKCDVMFAIDDRTQVVKHWRKIGITCLQCCDGDY